MADNLVMWICEVCHAENGPALTECGNTASHPAPGRKILRTQLVVPDEFAALLRSLKTDRVCLDAVLLAARNRGWTLESLASPLGISRERVRQRVNRGVAIADLPEIPPLPTARLAPVDPGERRLVPRSEIAEQLREMHKVARTVNGVTPVDHPSRAVSVELTALLQSLINQGVIVAVLAQTLEVNRNAITTRLARHGYRDPAPSLVGQVYTGQPHGFVRQENCLYGHPLTGENLYITPKGARTCRECDRRRGREYLARKRAKDGS